MHNNIGLVNPGVFSDEFLDYLFDLVEQTRDTEDESFNYSVIKLIVGRSAFLPSDFEPHIPPGVIKRAVHGSLSQ